jgi:type II secretion system protein H
MHQRQRGYSLPELLAVVMILGIVAVVAVPDISTTNPDQLELAAEEFAQAMRYARSEAIRTGEPRGFRQNASNNRIRVFRPDTSTSPWTLIYDVYHPVSKKFYDIDLDAHPFAEVSSVSNNRIYRGVCNTPSNVYFDNSGVPRCSDPETVLLDQYDVTLTLGGHSRTVTLHSITGRVTVQ